MPVFSLCLHRAAGPSRDSGFNHAPLPVQPRLPAEPHLPLQLNSPAEHEDVVQSWVVWEGCHLLETELLAAAVEAIGAVHPHVAVIAARAVLHGAEAGRALVGSESTHRGG